jgi:4-amino-4-deoxy-L-arabinose transferase-like glycosyltransferase
VAERPALLLAAVYLALALHGLGGADIVGDDEAREAGIVQDVVAGHWLWPRFNAELLPDKPILYHWLAAVPCAVTGFSETAVRLPSAVAAAALVGWTAWFGAELLGPPAGVAAAVILGTTPAFFARARVARPDMLLTLLLSAALGLAFRWWRDRHRRDASAALALLGLATFAKGPVAPVLFGLTVLAFLAWQGDVRRLPGLVTVPGAVAFAVLGLGWYAVALAGWGEPFVREHLVGRYVRNLAGGLASGGAYSTRSLGYHLRFYPLHLLAIALPWTPFAALALWRSWRAGGFRDPRLRFLLCWAAAPMVIFTPAEWKLRYYLLPSLPALALMAAPTVLALAGERPRSLDRRTVIALAVLVGLLGGAMAAIVGAGPGLLSRSDRDTLTALLPLFPGGAVAATIVGVVAGALTVAVALGAWRPVLAVVLIGSAAWMVAGAPTLEHAISQRDSLKSFAMAVRARYPPPASVSFYGETIRSVAVYLGRVVSTLRQADGIPSGLAVIATEPVHRSLARSHAVGPPLLTAEGRIGNLARGQVVLAEGLPR